MKGRWGREGGHKRESGAEKGCMKGGWGRKMGA